MHSLCGPKSGNRSVMPGGEVVTWRSPLPSGAIVKIEPWLLSGAR